MYAKAYADNIYEKNAKIYENSKVQGYLPKRMRLPFLEKKESYLSVH